jgi:hypothetical protein
MSMTLLLGVSCSLVKKENVKSMKLWSTSESDDAITNLLIKFAKEYRLGRKVNNESQSQIALEAYQAVLEFAWQRGYRGGDTLTDIELLPRTLMPQFVLNNNPLPVREIVVSDEARDLIHRTSRAELLHEAQFYTRLTINKKQIPLSIQNSYWHIFKLAWDFGWRPIELTEDEKLPMELMPDFYVDWLNSR